MGSPGSPTAGAAFLFQLSALPGHSETVILCGITLSLGHSLSGKEKWECQCCLGRQRCRGVSSQPLKPQPVASSAAFLGWELFPFIHLTSSEEWRILGKLRENFQTLVGEITWCMEVSFGTLCPRPILVLSAAFTGTFRSCRSSEKCRKFGTSKMWICHAKFCSQSKTENFFFVGRS